MPGLLAELDISVHYALADDCPRAPTFSEGITLKRQAMARCLRKIRDERGCCKFGVFEDSSQVSVLTVGDSIAEHRALQTLLKSPRCEVLFGDVQPLCKTLKLMSEPSFSEIGQQLGVLAANLDRLSLRNTTFALSAASPVHLHTTVVELFA